MAKIRTISSGARFPKKPKGSPTIVSKGTGKPDRGLGTGNNRFTKPNNWIGQPPNR